MAARSPVIIESSPDQAYHAPSITPDNARPSGDTASTTRSSPQLVSPSAFTRPRPQLLKSGSRAQQVPDGAHAGFASAASIWKVQDDEERAKSALEDEVRTAGGREDGEPISETKAAGKLKKPKKASRPRRTSVTASKGSESPKNDSFLESKADTVALLARVSGPSRANKEKPPQVTATSRRPSINIFEYSLNADAVPKQSSVTAENVSAVKKPTVRKRASKPDDKGKAPAPKKPRKPKSKSEAIILDSDEPELPLFDEELGDTEAIVCPSETVAKAPRSKAVRKPAKSRAKTDAVTSETQKTTKRCDTAQASVRESTEKSVYFAQQEPPLDLDVAPSPRLEPIQPTTMPQPQRVALADTTVTALSTESPMLPTELAPRRRRSWTPVKDSLAENTVNTLPIVNHELNERMGQTSFSEMLGTFSFLQSETVPAPRAANGEASAKRRRVELSDVPHHAQSADKPKAEAALKPPKAAKKPKAVPKKPQTITDRATEAYRPLKDVDHEQSTISAHFTPRKEIEAVAGVDGDGDGGKDTAAKVKKPRKSRAKVQTLEDNVAVPAKAKPKGKTTKVKVKFDEKDHQAPLCSPTQAMKQMKAQDFLFGTSSQLAAEESPDFIRDIQLAVRQSEMAFAMPTSSQIGTQLDPDSLGGEKSYASVPTAPHGTCLSIEQAHRELWCVSARDATGSKLAQERMNSHHDELPPASESHAALTHDTITISSSAHGNEQDQAATTTEEMPRSKTVHKQVHVVEAHETLGDRIELPSMQVEDTERDQLTTRGSNAEPTGDDWMLLHSDDSVCLPEIPSCPPPERPTELATSPARRTVLQALDTNIPLALPDFPGKSQARPFSTTVSAAERDRSRKPTLTVERDDDVQTVVPPKRGPGRPRKEPLLEKPVQTSPTRGPGRPRKEALLERPAQTSPARGRGRPRKEASLQPVVQTSPARGRGRPRKVVPPSDTSLLSPTKVTGSTRKEPQQVFRKTTHGAASQQTPQKEWTNIDEISDSDSPTTPSPKRRRGATTPSSPPFIRPLDFDTPHPTPTKTTTKTTTTAPTLKPTDPIWPTIQPVLFPLITHKITSQPPSHPSTPLSAAPTWHEKILLYDPIVLEDLAAWLNGQGVCTEFERVRAKTKGKGRGKTKKGEKKGEVEEVQQEVEELEVVRGEVGAWMVQRWCEENGVCCLWREGLRGGVKGRY